MIKTQNSEVAKNFLSAFPDAKLIEVKEEEDDDLSEVERRIQQRKRQIEEDEHLVAEIKAKKKREQGKFIKLRLL